MLRARYRRILFFFGRLILSVILWDIVLVRLGFRKMAARTRSERYSKAAGRFRLLAINMGGVMIKVGQFLSTRLDVLPREITDELQGLQDEVQPESFDDIRRELETELGKPLTEIFVNFNQDPLASASIGQVHRACIRQQGEGAECSGDYPEVVVKIQRPNIENIVETDLAALRIVSRWINYYGPIRKRANVPALLKELDLSIHEEMDYILEGEHAETFAGNFKDRGDVIVPKVFWNFTSRRVITLEDVQGIKITDYERIEKAGIDLGEVARRLFDTYLKQIFEDGFFHADPHPGNLFVNPDPEKDEEGRVTWKLAFVDFGMVGHVTEKAMHGLREYVIAVGTGDAARAVGVDKYLNILLPGADMALIEQAYSRIFERFWGMSTTEMLKINPEEMTDFLLEFRELLYDMPFQIPENFILLGRCLSILSGMCTGLDEDFNIWENVSPYAQKLISQDGESAINIFLKELFDSLKTVYRLPKRTDNIITRLEQGKLEFKIPELNRQLSRLERAQNKQAVAVLFAAFLLGSIQLYLAGDYLLAAGLGAAAFFCLLWLLMR